MGQQQKAEDIVNSWYLGKTSKHFESGDGGPATISSGKGDHGGVSYGSYQLSTTMKTVQEFMTATHNYNGAFNGLTPNTAAFNQKWVDVAGHDANFGEAQHQFIATRHYKPILEEINKKGYDFSDRGLAVQDLVWSTAVQYRHNAPNHIQRAEKESGIKLATATDEQLINIIQADKLKHYKTDFASSSAQWHGITNRMVHEKEALLTILNAEQQCPELAKSKLNHSTSPQYQTESTTIAAQPFTDPNHPANGLHASITEKFREFSEGRGVPFAEPAERICAALTVAGMKEGMTAVDGIYPHKTSPEFMAKQEGNPVDRMAIIDSQVATKTPVDTSQEQAQQVMQAQEMQALARSQQQAQKHSGPSMG